MLLSIIIVNYNGRDLLDKCLASLLSNSPACGFEVIVVDNGSSDGSQLMLKHRYPLARLVALGHNTGFSKANNIGIRESKGEFILLLNNDTVVCPHALDRMVNFARSAEKLGMVGPKLLNPDGTLQQSCYDFPTVSKNLMHLLNLTPLLKALLGTKTGHVIRRVLGREDFACFLAPESVRKIDYVKFACVLIPRRVFEQVGYLDENLFMYHEDCELGYRMQGCGLASYIFPFAQIVHLGKGSSNPGDLKIFLCFFSGLLYLFRKHRSYLAYLLFRITTATGILVRLFLLPITGGTDFRIFSREEPRRKLRPSSPLFENALRGYLYVLRRCLTG